MQNLNLVYTTFVLNGHPKRERERSGKVIRDNTCEY